MKQQAVQIRTSLQEPEALAYVAYLALALRYYFRPAEARPVMPPLELVAGRRGLPEAGSEASAGTTGVAGWSRRPSLTYW